MAEQLWKGRFSKAVDSRVNDFNSSIRFDQRMIAQDMRGSGVHAAMLAKQVIRDGGQTAQNIFAVLLGDDALLCQHGGVDAAATHILRDHPLVEADGGVEVVDAAVHRLGKPTLPELFCHNTYPLLYAREQLLCGKHPRPLRLLTAFASTSPKGRGLGKEMYFAWIAKGSHFGGAGIA